MSREPDLLEELPQDALNQVGGHPGRFAVRKGGDGCRIIKKGIDTLTEGEFYEWAYREAGVEIPVTRPSRYPATSKQVKDVASQLIHFMPKIYSLKFPEDGGSCFIEMQNLVHGFAKPCVLDLKMGNAMLWNDDIDAEKKQRTLRCSQGTSSETHGLRIIGMKAINSDGEIAEISCARKEGWALKTDEDLKHALHSFVEPSMKSTERALVLAEAFLEKTRELELFFEKQQFFTLYRSSILYVYDGMKPFSSADCKVVDVGGSFLHPGFLDESFLLGVRSLAALWAKLMQDLQCGRPRDMSSMT
jgi:hypothetical protein